MFVDISDYKSALAVENMLTPYKKGRLAPDKKNKTSQREDYAKSLSGSVALNQLCTQYQRYALMY